MMVAVFLACGESKVDLSGTWKTGFGTLKVEHRGDSLLGEFANGGKFSGFISNDTVYFKITEASFTSATLEGYLEIKDKNNMKGKVREQGNKVYDGTFYMMRTR